MLLDRLHLPEFFAGVAVEAIDHDADLADDQVPLDLIETEAGVGMIRLVDGVHLLIQVEEQLLVHRDIAEVGGPARSWCCADIDQAELLGIGGVARIEDQAIELGERRVRSPCGSDGEARRDDVERIRRNGSRAASLTETERVGRFFQERQEALIGRQLVEEIGAGLGAAHGLLGELSSQLTVIGGGQAHRIGGSLLFLQQRQRRQGPAAHCRIMAEFLAHHLLQQHLRFQEARTFIALHDRLGEANAGVAAHAERHVEHADEAADRLDVLLRIHVLPFLGDLRFERFALFRRRLGHHAGDPPAQPNVDGHLVVRIVRRRAMPPF